MKTRTFMLFSFLFLWVCFLYILQTSQKQTETVSVTREKPAYKGEEKMKKRALTLVATLMMSAMMAFTSLSNDDVEVTTDTVECVSEDFADVDSTDVSSNENAEDEEVSDDNSDETADDVADASSDENSNESSDESGKDEGNEGTTTSTDEVFDTTDKVAGDSGFFDFDVPSEPEKPETPEVPEVPEIPEVPETPVIPETPEVPETPVPVEPEIMHHDSDSDGNDYTTTTKTAVVTFASEEPIAVEEEPIVIYSDVDDVVPEPIPVYTDNTALPKTGDNSHITETATACGISLIALAGLIICERKENTIAEVVDIFKQIPVEDESIAKAISYSKVFCVKVKEKAENIAESMKEHFMDVLGKYDIKNLMLASYFAKVRLDLAAGNAYWNAEKQPKFIA